MIVDLPDAERNRDRGKAAGAGPVPLAHGPVGLRPQSRSGPAAFGDIGVRHTRITPEIILKTTGQGGH